MPGPCFLGCIHSPGHDIVVELWILAQTAPETELFSSIVALVDEVALVGVGVVMGDEGLQCAVPGLGLERVTLAQTEMDRLAEGGEESGLIGRVPAEAGAAVLARSQGGRTGAGAGGREGVVGHGGPCGPWSVSVRGEWFRPGSVCTGRSVEPSICTDGLPVRTVTVRMGVVGMSGAPFLVRCLTPFVDAAVQMLVSDLTEGRQCS